MRDVLNVLSIFFDQGVSAFAVSYGLTRKRGSCGQTYPGHFLTLTDRSIFTPEQESLWPAQNNLHWLRRNKKHD